MALSGVEHYKIEQDLRRSGYRVIAGVDEAGRGPLAGPVVVCAVVLPEDHNITGIKDSKLLSESERKGLSREIKKKAVAYSICSLDNRTIDKMNIRNATLFAMKRAAMRLIKKLGFNPDIVLVDGRDPIDLPVECRAIVKGDLLSENIGAASIIAKVHRDDIMKKYDIKYPQYGFAVHKGYPTERHYEAIREYGVCEIHRKSFRLYK